MMIMNFGFSSQTSMLRQWRAWHWHNALCDANKELQSTRNK